MVELGQLEAKHDEFAKRNVRLVAVSIEGREDAAQTQAEQPHLLILADADRHLAQAADVIHPHSGPGGSDTFAPTTILVDRQGVVRWLFRPDNVLHRVSPDELLAAVDKHLSGQR